MEYYVGIDVSLELSSVCVVDGRGKIVERVHDIPLSDLRVHNADPAR